jgi:sulfate permease, SulP family
MLFAPFRPRIFQSLQGYNLTRLISDAGAGLTVGVVALPLAMAFAIASGLNPEAGLWSAIIGGLLVSLLGGTNAQIAGPAGAFIVIVYGIVVQHGVANLLICTVCSGLLLIGLGLFKLGNLVRFVPVSIIIGFTNGIAALIALSQIKDLLGLPVAKLPASFVPQVRVISEHITQINVYALGLGAVAILGLFVWARLWNPSSRLHLQVFEGRTLKQASRVPGPMVALLTLTALAYFLKFPVETIGSKFGSIPQGLPAWVWPDFSWDALRQLITPTLTLTLLGAIESLLCARVADQVAHSAGSDKHDPNQELMAQGVANAVIPFFGGMPVTGTIARTITNIRSGANSPVSGLIHSATLLVVVLLAAPLALHIPLSVLAGILIFVAWNMGEWREFARALRFSNHYRLLMGGTFFLTVVFDLMVAFQVGLALACVLFVKRMGSLFRVDALGGTPVAGEPLLDSIVRCERFALHGAMFFGATHKLDVLVDVAERQTEALTLILDASGLLQLDTSGLDVLVHIKHELETHGGELYLLHLQEQPASLIHRSGHFEADEEVGRITRR